MERITRTAQNLIRIPCRLAQMAAHVPLLVAAAALTWIRNEGILCPVNQ